VAGQGTAIADDLSAEPFGALRWVLWNPDSADRASARFALARCGAVRHGSVQRDMATAADGSTGGSGSHCCSLWRVELAVHGLARWGLEWFGGLVQGKARWGDLRAADGSTEGSPSLLFSREQVWSGPAMQVAVGLGAAK